MKPEFNNENNKVNNQGIVTINHQHNEYHVPNDDNSIDFGDIEISTDFNKFLDDIGATFSHSHKEIIERNDLYIPSDLRFFSPNKINDKGKYIIHNLADLANSIEENGIKYLFLGNETSGKTSICKYLFINYFEIDLIPIFINGSELKTTRSDKLLKLVKSNFCEQYNTTIEFCKLFQLKRERLLLIIDDFHKSLNEKNEYRHHLIRILGENFKNIVITGSSMMPLDTIMHKEKNVKQNIFEEFYLYSILEFGPKLRYKLIDKWNRLGGKFIDDQEIIKQNDLLLKQTEVLLGKSYMPSYPFYILTLLQAGETSNNTQKPNYSLHGFYYELLINTAISKALEDANDISFYYNYLTDFAYYLFDLKQISITVIDLKNFHVLYCENYDIPKKYETYKSVEEVLVNAKMIDRTNGSVKFSYSYIYYFFLAKYFTNNIDNDEIRIIISEITKRLYKDEFADILMFLTHLSKDKFIIDELLKNSRTIFSEVPISKLEKEIEKINTLISELPKQVLEIIDVKESIDDELSDKDEIERVEKEIEKNNKELLNWDYKEDLNTIDVFAKITLALKTVDILGQIAKKYWGELNAQTKYEIAQETYFLGLRTLNFYLSLIENNTEMLVIYIKNLIINDKKVIKDRFELKQRIDETANYFLFKLCFLSSWNVIKRISNSIGYDKLAKTFERLLNDNDCNSVKLIDLSIKLDFNYTFPFDEFEKFKKEFHKSNLVNLLSKNLVIQYLYLYETDIKKKMKIANLVGIDIKQQRMIDGISSIKRKAKGKDKST
jgi:hypothetical protein